MLASIVGKARRLIASTDDGKAREDTGEGVLEYTDGESNLDMVKYLLSQGPDIKPPHADYTSYAVQDHLSTAAYLISRGIDTSHKDQEDSIYYAIARGDLPTVKVFLSMGYDVREDKKVLFYAARYGSITMIKLFLDRGADIHTNQDEALDEAIVRGDRDMIEYLLERGANIHARKSTLKRLLNARPPVISAFSLVNANNQHSYDPLIPRQVKRAYGDFATAVKRSMGGNLGGLVLHYL